MEGCLFCDMASGVMPVDKLHDDRQVFAIRDIHPQAPVHFMVIPKEHIATAADMEDRHAPLLARMIAVANDIAQREGIAEGGYRLVINMGRYLHIFHLHMHVLGGHRLGPEG
jgi:histidine triad (HIT) family protein